MEQPAFTIDSIPVMGRLMLAPMDGISDPPFRALTRQLGSALSISEFINCLEFNTHKDTHKHRYTFEAFERPFGVQLLDNDPARMALTAQRITAQVQPDFFDLNLGCCVRSVTSRGAGAGLMRTPGLVRQIFAAVREAVSVPITAKMRLGWDADSHTYLEIGQLLEELGVAMVALHARTARMAYNGKADWTHIGRLKATLYIPVVGNGDVLTSADARRMLAETGCDAVMVGRGAMVNPWLFAGREREDVRPAEVHAFMLKQLEAMLASYDIGALQAFRKFAKAYLLPYELDRETLKALLTCDEAAVFKQLLAKIFAGL